ncbi:MAG: class III poly(R)-hydroxyalkanoic acid synthase subunit PhaE [Rudaea sp.]|uniref:class III poly(R)-hydroxyalkanoic acid synthase subunit PhaE n=1 Tax=unclassified Rudaea TaxID=2627037 RepID=UPI0010FA2BFC|nr:MULTISPECIES: class III poly(R)-hydroxyalkanoic acid synthase subunit PhaE [unclassified Rudaea]MBN8884741.1 class III poly(R)-hydroxyalkanoic acid synthase subunit PhaE [Rudaea sp.]
MSEDKSMNDWLKDWDALQRQYFNAWSDLAQKAPFSMPPHAAPTGFPGAFPFTAQPPSGFPGFAPFGAFAGAPPAQGAPWQEGLEQWTRLFANADKQNETAERMIASAKTYAAMMQSLFAAPGAGDATANPAQTWFDGLRGGFAAAGAPNIPGFDPATNPFAKALREVACKGAQGFAELPAAFAPYLEQMRKEGLSWLQMPAFGLAREHQEHYQRTALAFFEYQRALREYNQLMFKASQRGFELLEQRLADRAEPGRAIESMKALYDLWVDAAEDAYAEIALSEEFSKAYGELANAQMRLRKQIQTEIERVSRELGMPTRTELDSISKRLHELRRELRENGGAQADTELEAQVAALRGEVAALKKSLAQTGAKNAAGAAVKSTPPAAAGAAATAPVPAPAKKRQAAPKAARAPRREAKPRVPAAVVRPRPVDDKAKADSFADAVAAMRRRVGGKPRLRAVAAELSKPSKGDKANGKRGKKAAKRK